jgi:hypothetical protein
VRNSSCENIHSVAISSETNAPKPTSSSRPVPPNAPCSFGDKKAPNVPPAPYGTIGSVPFWPSAPANRIAIIAANATAPMTLIVGRSSERPRNSSIAPTSSSRNGIQPAKPSEHEKPPAR